MARGQIIVETTELDRTANQVEELANTYKSTYGALFTTVQELQNSWAGEDNTAFTTQIEGFRNDFENMERLMRDYADYLRRTAESYRSTQDSLVNQAKSTLSTGM